MIGGNTLRVRGGTVAPVRENMRPFGRKKTQGRMKPPGGIRTACPQAKRQDYS